MDIKSDLYSRMRSERPNNQENRTHYNYLTGSQLSKLISFIKVIEDSQKHNENSSTELKEIEILRPNDSRLRTNGMTNV